jgi:hypothetical protein
MRIAEGWKAGDELREDGGEASWGASRGYGTRRLYHYRWE